MLLMPRGVLPKGPVVLVLFTLKYVVNLFENIAHSGKTLGLV